MRRNTISAASISTPLAIPEIKTLKPTSNDLRISASNLRKDREEPTDILDRIDILKVNETLKSLLEIKDKEEQKVEIQDAHRYEIKEYLDFLAKEVTCLV